MGMKIVMFLMCVLMAVSIVACSADKQQSQGSYAQDELRTANSAEILIDFDGLADEVISYYFNRQYDVGYLGLFTTSLARFMDGAASVQGDIYSFDDSVAVKIRELQHEVYWLAIGLIEQQVYNQVDETNNNEGFDPDDSWVNPGNDIAPPPDELWQSSGDTPDTVQWDSMMDSLTYPELAEAFKSGMIPMLPRWAFDLLLSEGLLTQADVAHIPGYEFSRDAALMELGSRLTESELLNIYFPNNVFPNHIGYIMDPYGRGVESINEYDFFSYFISVSCSSGLLDSRIYQYNDQWVVDTYLCAEEFGGREFRVFDHIYTIPEGAIPKPILDVAVDPLYDMERISYVLFDSGEYTATYRTAEPVDGNSVTATVYIRYDAQASERWLSEIEDHSVYEDIELEAFLNGITSIRVSMGG